jgi:hypothetical protein
MFQFGQKLKFEGKEYVGISQVGFNNEKGLYFWLAIKSDGTEFPAKVYLIPQEYPKEMKEKLKVQKVKSP